jgi:hypothetical protein
MITLYILMIESETPHKLEFHNINEQVAFLKGIEFAGMEQDEQWKIISSWEYANILAVQE